MFFLGLAAGRFYPVINLLWLLSWLMFTGLISLWIRCYNRKIDNMLKANPDPGVVNVAFPAYISDFARADKGLSVVYKKFENTESHLEHQKVRYAGENLDLLIKSTTDPLTGVSNREHLNSYMKKLFARKGPPISLIMMDIDYFKKVNDTYGHDAGDKVLKQFAGIVRKAVRPSDQVFRYGGEEFTVVCNASLMEAFEIAGRVRAKVEKTPVAINDNLVVSITASFGVAQYRPGDTPDNLGKRADEALYRAKLSGRNKVCKEDIKG
ncbi:MAG: GGDEF domain-containing protein [Firmicutes bacterium]|nr:GGDEF domain-containing protein [Bacillota bacterium]